MYRRRSTGQLVSAGTCTSSQRGFCGTGNAWQTMNSNLSTCQTGETRRTYDYVRKNFRKAQKAGAVFFNPFFSEHYSASCTFGPNFQVKSTALQCPAEGLPHEFRVTSGYGMRLLFVGGAPGVAAQFAQNEIEPYLNDVATRVRSSFATSSNNLFESLAEAGKTAAMLDNKLSRINALLDAFRSKGTVKGNLKASLRTSRQLSNEYLLYRYGIRPLMQDIDAILKASIKYRKGSVRETFRATGSVPTRTNTVTSYLSHDTCLTTVTKKSTHSIEIRGTMLGQTNANLLTEIGFRSKGLFTLPIELIPYSFVGDWFHSLGDYLRSMAPSFETSPLGACLSVKSVIITEYTVNNTVANSPYYTVVSGINESARAVTITKERYDLPAASLQKRPDFGLDRMTRVADLAALITQKLADPRIFSAWRVSGRLK